MHSDNLLAKDAASINLELSNFMDHTSQHVKKFINTFIEKVESQRRYEEEVKNQLKTGKKKGMEGKT